MGAKIQAFDIFQTPLSSHYQLPLNSSMKGMGVLRVLISDIHYWVFKQLYNLHAIISTLLVINIH